MSPGLGLPPELVHRSFPFHASVDAEGRFAQVGPGLARLCPGAVPGGRVDDVLVVRSPPGLPLSGAERRDCGLVLVVARTSGGELLLRGELALAGEHLWFLGSPWVTDLADLAAQGLTLADFAGHDPVTDLLLLLQAQRSAQADVESLLDQMRTAQAEQDRVLEQERRLAAELRALPDLALRLDRDGILTGVRPAREGEMASADQALVGQCAYEAFPWLAEQLPGAVHRALSGTAVQQLSARTESGGQAKHYEVRVVASGDGQVLVLVRDVSEVRSMEEQLRHRAFHDPLTGLANRSLFADRVEHALSGISRSGAAPVLLLVDLDGFKTVNDVHGHLVGDELLTAVGARLGAMVRPQDTVARLGGDEFAVLLHDGGQVEGEQVAARLLDTLGRPVRTTGAVLSTSASVGVVCARDHDDLLSLLRHGDMALYAAKQRGRRRFVVYDEEMSQRLRDRHSLELDLREALTGGDLVLHYQPIRDLLTGADYGWEALMRWQHPQLGLLSPELFLPLAEDMGAMDVLAVRALRQAALDAVRLGGLMHVNLSPSQLGEASIVDVVDAALHGAGLPGEQLVLELTESSLLQQPDEAHAVLVALRDLGVGISLDDFGTGFSSLSRLHTMPITGLKIDGSLVTALGEPGRDAVAQAVVSLGSTLGLTVVAEGIETELQAAELRRIGCRLGQGFHLGRPALAPA